MGTTKLATRAALAAVIHSSLLLAQLSHAADDTSTADAADPATLRKVKVEADEESGDGPVTGYRATRSNTGTRTDTPLQLAPISVQVVSREAMDDQQVLTVSDAIKNVSGVYTRQGPDGNTKAQLNISNATDEVYYPSGYGNTSRIAQGTPKNVLASFSVAF